MSEILNINNLTREELYEKVWTTPIRTIAKQFSLTDHIVISLCDKKNIPRPPTGYWSRLKHGYHLERPALPENEKSKSQVSNNLREKRTLSKNDYPNFIHHKVTPKIEAKLKSSSQTHPLITKTYQAYRSIQPDKTDRLRSKDQALDVYVGYRNLDRALNFMSALIEELETQNYSVNIEMSRYGDRWITHANINGEKLPFHIEESLTKKPITSNNSNPTWRNQKYEHVVTGNLSLVIDNFLGENRQKSWTDSKTRRLEERVSEIVEGLVEATAKLKVILAERKKIDEQIRAETEQRENIESEEHLKKKQIAQLDPCSLSWEKALRIRRFVSALEKATIKKFGRIEVESGVASFIERARAHADSIDPVIQTLKTLDGKQQP